MIARRVVATGRVQGVFFRDACRRQAQRLGVSGWVTNRDDGTVEAVFEGPPDAVTQMISWARSGPPQARVDHLAVHHEPTAGEPGFRVV